VRFVLDTNAVSEFAKPRPNEGVSNWRQTQNAADLFVTTVTVGEVWQGFHKLSPNHRDYDRIKRFASELPEIYRILNFDSKASEIWGELIAKATAPFPLRDSFIAAIALSRGYRVVTRDSEVFERMGCKVVNPWT
jgi:toxin FitB